MNNDNAMKYHFFPLSRLIKKNHQFTSIAEWRVKLLKSNLFILWCLHGKYQTSNTHFNRNPCIKWASGKVKRTKWNMIISWSAHQTLREKMHSSYDRNKAIYTLQTNYLRCNPRSDYYALLNDQKNIKPVHIVIKLGAMGIL